MTWEELQIFLKGKVFLIGINFIDQDENLMEQYQTSGVVLELTDSGLFKFKRTDGSIFQLPYDREAIKQTPKGEYREIGTGDIITDPDYVTTWDIKVKSIEDMEDCKKSGFSSPV